jgi:hypothetical protein
VAMLGLLGLRIFEATGANIADLGEEHGHRVLRVCGKGSKIVLVPLPPAVGRAIDQAIGPRTSGPILLNTHDARMDRHAATRRLRRLAETARVQTTKGSSPHASPHLRHDHARRRSRPARRPDRRPPPCVMTGPARTSTATRTTSSPPTWPPAPDQPASPAAQPGSRHSGVVTG